MNDDGTGSLVRRIEDLLEKAARLAGAAGDEQARDLLAEAQADAVLGASATDVPVIAASLAVLRHPDECVPLIRKILEANDDRPEISPAVMSVLLAADTDRD